MSTPTRPLSRPSKMALAWISRAGGTVEACGGSGTCACWETPRDTKGWRVVSHQVVMSLEARGLLRFTGFRVGRDGKTRPVKAELVT